MRRSQINKKEQRRRKGVDNLRRLNMGRIDMNRFKKVYNQGTLDVMEIWVDTETGVNYVFHRNGNASGFTPLLDREGKPVVSKQEEY